MSRLLNTILILLAVPSAAWAGDAAGYDYDAWRDLPVQEGGRYMPLDTLARETARTLGDPSGFVDPETGWKLDAFDFILTLQFSRKVEGPLRRPGDEIFHIDRPDGWDAAPLLGVDSAELRKALGIPAEEEFISPLDLAKAKYRDPESGVERTFLQEVRTLVIERRSRTLTDLEQKTLRLADAFGMYRELRGGRLVHFVPVPGDAEGRWMSGAELLEAELSKADDPSGLLRKAQTEYRRVLGAFRGGAAIEFHRASAELFATLEELGRQVKDYPSSGVIALEVGYNRTAPFRWAGLLSGIAFVLSLAVLRSRKRIFLYAALTAAGAAMAVMVAGMTVRGIILGWVPLTNMYETMVYLALGSVLFGLIFELFSLRGYVLTAAVAVSTMALLVADFCPTIFNPSIVPPLPVLRSNFWLVIHVKSIMLGYVMFALAWALGNMSLGMHLFRKLPPAEDIADLHRSMYRLLKTGLLLLALGTILGALWAEYAWSRFWGWDPKEVGALVTLLAYLALLHARRIGWAGDLGMAAGSACCFATIIFTWYVVNYVLGTGKHSYGFGGGGAIYVYAAGLLQALYAGAAVLRGLHDRSGKRKPLAI
jgi:ABC-type transport system involved in cytochrome c biogenesis permease subunit